MDPRARFSPCIAAFGLLAPIAGADTFNGYLTYPYAPYVAVYCPDQAADVETMLPENSGPFVGYASALAECFGPAPASSFLSIDCPAPQESPGSPTLVRFEYSSFNESEIYGEVVAGGTGVLYFGFAGPGPTHYRIEWVLSYTGAGGGLVATVGHGASFDTPSFQQVVLVDAIVDTMAITGVIQGVAPGSGMVFQANQTLYQGQHVAGGGLAVLECRVLVDTKPIPASADLNNDGVVDGSDIGLLLGAWGACPMCFADLTGDGVVDGGDLGAMLGAWG